MRQRIEVHRATNKAHREYLESRNLKWAYNSDSCIKKHGHEGFHISRNTWGGGWFIYERYEDYKAYNEPWCEIPEKI